ncbi:unnamed protein product [Nyctereutes procyonoides]|uniref:Ribosomal protein L15 n=1 Tax=Nyctereutes procyonoides TaxID=34880 RepID=A0A811YIY6_NYCPR|nr:unnamed protein product [Nyctereutes procyonoides]
MEEKAVQCNALSSQDALLAVPPALWASQGPCPIWPNRAHRLGYKTKQGYVIYWIHVCCKHLVPKGATYSKPIHHWVNQFKFAQNLQSVAEEGAGCHCVALRVLNSYWVGEESLSHKHREMRGLTSTGHEFHHTIGGSCHAAWRRCNTLQLHHYC